MDFEEIKQEINELSKDEIGLLGDYCNELFDSLD